MVSQLGWPLQIHRRRVSNSSMISAIGVVIVCRGTTEIKVASLRIAERPAAMGFADGGDRMALRKQNCAVFIRNAIGSGKRCKIRPLSPVLGYDRPTFSGHVGWQYFLHDCLSFRQSARAGEFQASLKEMSFRRVSSQSRARTLAKRCVRIGNARLDFQSDVRNGTCAAGAIIFSRQTSYHARTPTGRPQPSLKAALLQR
jgi:hypothetical protein